jgi:uncharacterized RDD family membrane protein YckC
MEPQTDTTEAAAPVVQVPTATPVATSSDMNMAHGAPLASAGQRFGARLLDSILISATLGIGYLIWLMITWGKGQTPGKSLLGLRVIDDETGKAATFGKMFYRGFVLRGLLNGITLGIYGLIGCFGVIGASHKATWDKGAKTTVVVDKAGALV